MAILVTPVDSVLRLQYQVGTDADGNPIYRLVNYSRVKPESSDQDVYDVAQVLAGLQQHTLAAVRREIETDLAEGV